VIIGGRTARQVADAVRHEIVGGRISVGTFLPSLRDLAGQHDVAQMTVRRALAILCREGLLVSEARRGYRVISATAGSLMTLPVAHVSRRSLDVESDNARLQITPALQRALGRYGTPMLSIGVGEQTPEQVLEQIRLARAWGVVVDADIEGLPAVLQTAGLPVIMVNEWQETAPFDVVHQDNYVGGFLAARHLVERGCRRMAWLGQVADSSISRERFAGAAAALRAVGLEIPPERQFLASEAAMDDAAQRLLAARPDGVLALWTGVCVTLMSVLRRNGMAPDRKFPVVGWAIHERYELLRPLFPGEPIPPMIVWQVEDMARVVAGRLVQRRADPEMPRARINVPVSLRMGD
jgi:DNA-binding LacI/PurR family transcriptional regulator